MLNILNKKAKTEKEIEIDEIKKDIRECEFLMERNRTIFNMAIDENLIESKIFEREALLKQYDYLLILLKEKQGIQKTIKIGSNQT